MDALAESATEWVSSEDQGRMGARSERLKWLLTVTPPSEIWVFHGGWLCKQLFEESRYSYIYGQFIASAVLGFAFVERTLAAMHYAAGRNDLQRTTSAQLFKEALNSGWLGEEELEVFEKARELRNPLVHFRKPLHKDLPEWRSFMEECEPHEIVEADAKQVLSAVFRLVARNAVG